ncbi:MAG: hypothetical protein HQL32_01945 [Planctomycetes bacterium]|nr:hypothetical protein [Planctomycetota bacterium]
MKIFSQDNYKKLELVYEALESLWGSMSRPCDACGWCCHFDQAEHRLYTSSLELSWLLQKYPLDNKPINDTCPFLVDNKCQARERRMLGCRTFFRQHNSQEKEKAESLYEDCLNKIKAIYQDEGLDWEYRDLMPWLKEEFEKK